MSGALASLSRYADSDSDDAATPPNCHSEASTKLPADKTGRLKAAAATVSTRRKRKLPALEADFLRKDGPDTRSSLSVGVGVGVANAVRGDWLCYCFIEVLIDASLSKCIRRGHQYLQEHLGSDHVVTDLLNNGNSLSLAENESLGQAERSPSSTTSRDRLHVSLTRPFTVRSYERDEYVKVATAHVQKLKATISSFPFNFSRIAHLSNDDASRHFVVLEIGPGRDKLHTLSTALSTELRRAFRAKTYYDEARYHASTACVTSAASGQDERSNEDAATESFPSRLSRVVDSIEAEWGPEVRRCPPVWATRIGVQVANRITYVDL